MQNEKRKYDKKRNDRAGYSDTQQGFVWKGRQGGIKFSEIDPEAYRNPSVWWQCAGVSNNQ